MPALKFFPNPVYLARLGVARVLAQFELLGEELKADLPARTPAGFGRKHRLQIEAARKPAALLGSVPSRQVRRAIMRRMAKLGPVL